MFPAGLSHTDSSFSQRWRLAALLAVVFLAVSAAGGAQPSVLQHLGRQLLAVDGDVQSAPEGQESAPPLRPPPRAPSPPLEPSFPFSAPPGSQCIRDRTSFAHFSIVSASPGLLEARGLLPDNSTAGRTCWRRPHCLCDRWLGVCPNVDPSDWLVNLRPEFGTPEAQAALLEAHSASVTELATWLSGRRTLFLGDSITKQLFNYLLCDLMRLGYNATKLPPLATGPAGFSHNIVSALNHWSVSGRGLGDGTTIGLLHNVQFHPAWSIFESVAWADTVVMNFGMHFAEADSVYELVQRWAIGTLADFGKVPGKAGLFREVTAQGFYGSGAFAGMQQARGSRSKPEWPLCVRRGSHRVPLTHFAALDRFTSTTAPAARWTKSPTTRTGSPSRMQWRAPGRLCLVLCWLARCRRH